jgi:hypothetical protein
MEHDYKAAFHAQKSLSKKEIMQTTQDKQLTVSRTAKFSDGKVRTIEFTYLNTKRNKKLVASTSDRQPIVVEPIFAVDLDLPYYTAVVGENEYIGDTQEQAYKKAAMLNW